MFFANSINCDFIVKGLKALGQTILDKVQEFDKEEEDVETATRDLYDKVIEKFIQEFSLLAGASDSGNVKLTLNAAFGLINFALTLTTAKSYQPRYSPDFAKVMLAILQFLIDDHKFYERYTSQVYSILKQAKDFNMEDFTTMLKDSWTKQSKFTFLALVHFETNKQDLLKYLCDKYRDLVMNDKEKLNYWYLKDF